MQEIPTFKPTKEEFEDPIAYLSNAEVSKFGLKYGMIKIIPPESFKPGFNINESSFNFKCRLQTLCELDLRNRSRLFFWKQLNNFRRSRKHGKLLRQPFDEGTKLFYYDVYITCVKYYNKSSHQVECYKRTSRKRKRDDHVLSNLEIQLVDPDTMMRDDKMWNSLGNVFSCPSDHCKKLYQSSILPYYRFLYENCVRYGSKNFFDRFLYKQKYPKSLLEKDSDDGSPYTDEPLFSDLPDSLEEDEDIGYFTDEDENDPCPVCSQIVSKVSSSRECESCKLKFHSKCVKDSTGPATEWVCNSCIVGNGYYGFKEPQALNSLESFKNHCKQFDDKYFPHGKPSSIEKMEKLFWENVETISECPLTVRYGADIHSANSGEMSAFPTSDYVPARFKEEHSEEYKEYLRYVKHPWNLVNLPTAKGSLLSILDRNISGITVPWIYVGSTFSTFCWHLEDQYTFSANYQHQGEPKIWYSIPASSTESFNKMMKQTSPDLFDRQPDLLHQLVTLISPYSSTFHTYGIECYKAIQHPGEFIITFPKCYHSGFNCGYNFNEAVNFTTDLWLLYGLESIKDYKATNRMGVINLFELMQNILEEYVQTSHKFDASFISTCISELKIWFNSEFKMLKKIKTIVNHEVYSDACNKMPHFALNTTSNNFSKSQKTTFADHGIDEVPMFYDLTKNAKQNQHNNGLYASKSSILHRDAPSEDTTRKQKYDGNDPDKDVFCSNCKAICPMAFIVHCAQKRHRSQRRKFSAFTPNDWNLFSLKPGIELLCLEDYLKLIEKNEEETSSSDIDYRTDDDLVVDIFENDSVIHINNVDAIRSLITKAERTLERKLR